MPSSSQNTKRKRSNEMWNSSSSRSKKRGGSNSGSTTGSYRHGSAPMDEAATVALFAEIADEDDPSVAGMEGISKLCEKLDIDPLEDIRILVLLWKLGSKEKPAQISKEEWTTGCQTLQVDSIDKFKELLPSLDIGFLDQTDFRDFYKFCFRFNLHSTHRTLDKEMVVALMNMILKGRIAEDRLESFCAFLEDQKSYTRITLDQWTSFLEFCYECEDLSSYDESLSAWPVLIDEYVEYMGERQKK